MPGEVKFRYDEKRNILFTEDNFELKSEADVEEFFRLNEEECRKYPAKFHLVSNINGLRIHAKMIAAYGRKGKELQGRYILGSARYASDPFARMSIRTAYSKAGEMASIFDTQEEALKSLGFK
jgi:hypothetical protein